MMKLCRLCGVEAEHSVRKTGATASHCKQCQREYSKQHYLLNKQKHNKRRYQNNKLRLIAMKQWLAELKRRPCTDCRGIYHPQVMEFDHLKDKDINISETLRLGWSKDRILAEIDKCELVCANCHRMRTINRRDIV